MRCCGKGAWLQGRAQPGRSHWQALAEDAGTAPGTTSDHGGRVATHPPNREARPSAHSRSETRGWASRPATQPKGVSGRADVGRSTACPLDSSGAKRGMRCHTQSPPREVVRSNSKSAAGPAAMLPLGRDLNAGGAIRARAQMEPRAGRMHSARRSSPPARQSGLYAPAPPAIIAVERQPTKTAAVGCDLCAKAPSTVEGRERSERPRSSRGTGAPRDHEGARRGRAPESARQSLCARQGAVETAARLT